MDKEILNWLISGDISIQYIVNKFILKANDKALSKIQTDISKNGYAKEILDLKNKNGQWGIYYYQPKWTSSHYTLLDLKNLYVSSDNIICKKAVQKLIDDCFLENGGFNLSKSKLPNDICVDGMILNYASYFASDDIRLKKTIDLIISSQKDDGGFVQYTNGETDPHATICVLEGLNSFKKHSFNYRKNDIELAEEKALAYFYNNNLFFDNREYKKLSYPFRYKYDLLRFLNYCVDNNVIKNEKIQKAIEWLLSKKCKDGKWYLENVYKGKVHIKFGNLKTPDRFLTAISLKIIEKNMASKCDTVITF